MQTAKVILILLIIFIVVWLFAYLGLSHAIMDIKDSLENIKYACNNNGEISNSEYVLKELITKSHKDLLTEIACLATKNNEDIKRLSGNYEIGDILRFDGIRWYIFGKDLLNDGRTRWKLFGENGADYRIYTDTIPEGIEFLGHRDLPFD